jgi:hypothetical protein
MLLFTFEFLANREVFIHGATAGSDGDLQSGIYKSVPIADDRRVFRLGGWANYTLS